MKNKIYISIFLWLSFIVLVVSYFTQNTEKQHQALKETQETVLRVHKKMYNDKFNTTELLIHSMGNNPRYRVVQNTVQEGEILLNSMFAEAKIENQRILPFLYKEYYSMEVMKEVDDTEKILKELKEYKGNNEIIEQVNFLDRYQTSFGYLYKHYEKIGDFRIRFAKTNIVNASDTTLGFEFVGSYDDYIIPPENKVMWALNSFGDVALIDVETHTKEDTVRKRYKVIPSKNDKINPFDYEERE
ncbi:hypothetical protein ACE193_22290 [Bernardetia sp. OM2101]|uniref:hypothetical protein n=1 Tax=Bernardetia sp. OM2101 TaxID=3344876 RepID=UPI0035CFD705